MLDKLAVSLYAMGVPQNTAVHKQHYRFKKVLHMLPAYVHDRHSVYYRGSIPRTMRSAYVSLSVMRLIPHKKRPSLCPVVTVFIGEVNPLIKGYIVPYGYMGLVSGNYILFATESEYLDYMT